jgi:hypothetical protein
MNYDTCDVVVLENLEDCFVEKDLYFFPSENVAAAA